jgi:hypothetical protein
VFLRCDAGQASLGLGESRGLASGSESLMSSGLPIAEGGSESACSGMLWEDAPASTMPWPTRVVRSPQGVSWSLVGVAE